MADTVSTEPATAKNSVAADLNTASEQDGKWVSMMSELRKDLRPQAAAEEEDDKLGGKPQSNVSNIKQQAKRSRYFLKIVTNPKQWSQILFRMD